jgi:hypothetical protein
MNPLVQVGLGLLLCLGLLLVYVMWPVCVPIPDSEVPNFETVRSLEERAAQGEPFEKKGAHWYQCKARLARAFF